MPGINAEIVVLVPVPLIVPGLIIQLPEGKPVKIILPVPVVHVGCVIVPRVGAGGVTG